MKRIVSIIVLFICSMGISQTNVLANDSKSAGGFWKNNSSTATESNPIGSSVQSARPGLPSDNPGEDSPVGEGIWLLLACAGGYALKRRARCAMNGERQEAKGEN